ncbi:ParB N-terminal domain-containing protein [Streptomyces erythrochromogenes]|uniref:ParB/RepB/Spo0J family partition protein n=1 Tax=Streptomyces erythrochromogenes TaxID=285574 RepID=UPI00343145F2
MTAITTEPTTADSDTQETTTSFTGQFIWVDPRDLIIDPYNHRKRRGDDDNGTEPDPALIDSVLEFGVHTPLLLRPQTGAQDGLLGVVFGQRRMKAALIAAQKAVAAGEPVQMVPAIVREDLRDADDEALALSVIENVHRREASTLDVLDAAEQLALMPVGKLKRERAARALGITPEEITAAPRAAKLSDKALREATTADFDLVEMADYQTVEEVPGALSKLKRAKTRDNKEPGDKRGNWAHALAELRQEQQEQQERERIVKELAEQNIQIMVWRSHRESKLSRSLSDLVTEIGNPMTPEHHTRCPGRAAALAPGEVEVEWICTDWKRYGHELTDEATAASKKNKSTPEELDARRKVIRYNKAWRTARGVRQEYIAKVCSANGEADDATWTLILSEITGTSIHYGRHASNPKTELISAFLGLPDPNKDRSQWNRVKNPYAKLIATTPKSRRWRLLLAQVAAMFESENMHDGAWRNVDDNCVTWLSFLKGQGYTLSEVEAEVLADGLKRYRPARQKK